MVVVIDSNIWLKEQMLRHSSGSALRFFLRTRGARVALPEVVRREVIRHLSAELHELSTNIKDSHGRLLRHVGALRELVLPSQDELQEAAISAFESARLDLLDVPFSLEAARASLEKCIAGAPPSGPKDQQFKDGVVWADCIRLAAGSPVLLVTADKGFFRNRSYEDGLAQNLAAESGATKHGVTIAHELAAVLDLFRTPVTIDYGALGASIPEEMWDKVKNWIGQQGFVVGGLISGNHRLFATDDPSTAHLEFDLSYDCVHPDEREGTLVFRGESTYLPDSGTYGPVQQRGEEFEFVEANGEKRTIRAIYGTAEITLGHRTIRHHVRAAIERAEL